MPTAMTTLQLKNYFYPNILIKANPKYKLSEKTEEAKLDVKSNLTRLPDNRGWRVILDLKTIQEENPIPYEIEIKVVGFFQVAPDYPEAEVEDLVRIGGSSILYSATRDFVLTISSRGPWGPVFVPSVSFTKEIEKKESTPDKKS